MLTCWLHPPQLTELVAILQHARSRALRQAGRAQSSLSHARHSRYEATNRRAYERGLAGGMHVLDRGQSRWRAERPVQVS